MLKMEALISICSQIIVSFVDYHPEIVVHFVLHTLKLLTRIFYALNCFWLADRFEVFLIALLIHLHVSTDLCYLMDTRRKDTLKKCSGGSKAMFDGHTIAECHIEFKYGHCPTRTVCKLVLLIPKKKMLVGFH